jgi:hypothetical protein
LTGDHERHAAPFEVVDRRERVGESAGVDDDDGADGPTHELVPQEVESRLTGRSEQIQDEVVVAEGDPPEVHRHRRGRLVRRLVDGVERLARLGHRCLGAQRVDLRDRPDERGLAHSEAARDNDLDRDRNLLVGRGGGTVDRWITVP